MKRLAARRTGGAKPLRRPAPVLYLLIRALKPNCGLMGCMACSSGRDSRLAHPRPDRADRTARPGMLGVIVCRHCGAVHPLQEAQDAGIRVLAHLASVGLGAGAPPVLSTDQRGN